MKPGRITIAKLVKALRDPRKAAAKVARRAGAFPRFLNESARLRLGLNDYDHGRAESFLDLAGSDLASHFAAKTCALWDMPAFEAMRENCPPAEREALLEAAERVLSHRFDYLGSGPVHVSTGRRENGYEFIDWHRDFRHGSTWPAVVHHKRIRVTKGDGSDIKYVWELSRLAHLMTLGQAFVLTGEAKYVEEYKSQVIDWLAHNPMDAGPNWQCCMEVGIRAANLALSYSLIASRGAPDEGFLRLFLPGLWRHCHHIVRNLEWSDELTSNHYLSNVSGLYLACALFPELKRSSKWLAFARRELEREMVKQTLSDGTNFEASTSYHRLVLELFFYPAVIGAATGRPFPDTYLALLEKQFRAVQAFMKHDGRINQIGDNDSGRYFIFFPDMESTRHSYLLALGAQFFGKGDLAIRELLDERESRWIFPGRRLASLSADFKSVSETLASDFPDSGWFIYRDADTHLQIACGPNGQGPYGGHAHNDKLSFCLQYLGEDILVDPGTYVYTSDPSGRNRFRSTSSHNTASLDGLEQNPIPGYLFMLPDKTCAQAEEWTADIVGFSFKGSHRGFAPVIHRREIAYSARVKELRVRDRFEGVSSTAKVHVYFQLHPDVGVEMNGAGGLALRARKATVVLRCLNPAVEMRVEKSSYSSGYGMLQETSRIVVSMDSGRDSIHEFAISLGAPGTRP